MKEHLLRPWRASAARSRRTNAPCPALRQRARLVSMYASSEEKLESVSDWKEFQSRRERRNIIVDYFDQLGSTQNRDNTFQPHHSLHRPVPPNETTLSALIASGAHFGHSSSLMNPNFVPYAYGTRAGITVIDLDHTLALLRRAAKFVRGVTQAGGSVVFVGTRPDLRKTVQKAAERIGSQAFHVGERWLPGTLTNRFDLFGAELEKIRVTPDLVVFLNPLANMPAIRECAMHHVPTIGIVDSNVDPRIVMYPIPANDESTRTAEMVAGVLSIAGREGAQLFDEEQEIEQLESSLRNEKAEKAKVRHGYRNAGRVERFEDL